MSGHTNEPWVCIKSILVSEGEKQDLPSKLPCYMPHTFVKPVDNQILSFL